MSENTPTTKHNFRKAAKNLAVVAVLGVAGSSQGLPFVHESPAPTKTEQTPSPDAPVPTPEAPSQAPDVQLPPAPQE